MRLRGQLVCPLDAGRYTLMPSGLAFLDVPEAVSGALDLQPIVFEAAAGDADCRHDVVVPFPGGFGRGIGCLAGVTFSFEQGGCGVGIIDSDGGSDFTVKENADTSDRSAVCSLSQPGCEQYRNRSLRNDVTVGDGVTDACAPPGTANMIVSIPLIATVWQDAGGCPAPDMTFDPGTDALVARVVQIANLTTSTATVEFVDLDGDHCIHDLGLSFGPSSASGTCFDLGGRSVSLAAAAPGNDATLGDFISTLFAPFTVSGASAPTGATCATPPPTPVDGGTAPRCIVPPECGDGVVGAGETCDGANDGACPGHCRADCLCAGCMNDVAEVGEECDWSDDAACPGRCLSDCTCGP